MTDVSPDMPPQPTAATGTPVAYNTGASLTVPQIAAVCFQAQFRGESLVTAVAISCAEDTDHDPTALNDDPSTGDLSVGLFQVNYFGNLGPSRTAQFGPMSGLTDPLANAQAAYSLSGGGTNFTPWSTFKSDAYLQYLTVASGAATAAVTAASLSPPGSSYLLPPPSPAAATSANANNASLQQLINLVDPTVAYRAPGDDIVSKPPYDPGTLTLPDGTQLGKNVITGGTVDLQVAQVSQITFVISDPGLILFNNLKINLDDWVYWQGYPWVIASVQIDQDQGLEEITIVVRSAGAEMFQTLRSGPLAGGIKEMLPQCANLAPASQTANGITAPAPGNNGPYVTPGTSGGLSLSNASFSVQIDPAVPDDPLARQVGDMVNPAEIETDWAMFQRGAAEIRAWFFEDSGVFYLGRPSWLVSDGSNGVPAPGVRQFKVGWLNGWGGDETYRAISCPQWSVDRDTLPITGMIQVQLPRTRGEQVRPGMRMNVQGMGVRDQHGPDLYDAAVTVQPGYIVTRVTWPLDDGDTPVTVYGQEPVDPFPTDANAIDVSTTTQAPTAALYGKPAAGTQQSIDFVNEALTYQGTPYLLGGNSKSGLDCSGLVQQALAFVGVYAPRTSGAQLQWCQQKGTTISLEQGYNTYGALLFAPADGSDHVAISMGDGTNALEAYLPPYGVGVYPISWQSGSNSTPFGAAALVPGLVYPGSSSGAGTT